MGKRKSFKEEVKNEVVGIAFFGLSIFICFCLWQGTGENDITTIGAVGSFIYRVVTTMTGNGKYLLPIVLFLWGITKVWKKTESGKYTFLSWLGLYIALLACFHLKLPLEMQTLTSGWEGYGGGVIGALLTKLTVSLFGEIGSYIFLSVFIVFTLIGIARKPLSSILKNLSLNILGFLSYLRQELIDFIFTEVDEEAEEKPKKKKVKEKVKEEDEKPVIFDNIQSEEQGEKEEGENFTASPAVLKEKDSNNSTSPEDIVGGNIAYKDNFEMPSVDILQNPPKLKGHKMNKDITDKVQILEETLDNFGVKARVTQVSRGPSITRYEIQPPPGVKVSRIVGLADDIALSLAAPQVRIEAPIPGKAAVGIEVPNEEIAVVTLREVLETKLFLESKSNLTVALGKDIGGNPIVADLAKMPHLLIAGATGSGKSVCMNSIIASVLYKAHPDDVKLLMIDPKVVELSNFNGIPHLISPVVTDPKKAASALRWAVHEMETRYELFANTGAKDIVRYNQIITENSLNTTEDDTNEGSNIEDNTPMEAEKELAKLPQLVVLIDELADLMMVAPADVEDAICRLAQMARAAGIHLVVATQRPSVDVITGIIKANIPSRIAFAVSSQTDSRTILDMGGAEKLLGRGDMLFYPTGMAKPLRVQGVFVSDQEIERLVDFLKAQKSPQYQETSIEGDPEIQGSSEDDELLPQAAKIFIENGQASISLLQRRLRIGYTRAARIVDQLEEKGIVGGYEGSKPRTIRMTWEEYERTFSG